ncbi:MAG TPA: hypothetical protein DCM40_10280, partial [Maribacter sp.]|nr:hypothetical protein [Maribacter sp.]
ALLTEKNGRILAHILGLDGLLKEGSKIKPEEIIQAYKNPEEFAKRLDYTDADLMQPILGHENLKSESRSIVLLEHSLRNDLYKGIESQDNYYSEVYRRKDIEKNVIPELGNPTIQAVINILNDGFMMRMPLDATPRDLLMANLELADVLLEPKTKKIAKSFYENRGIDLTHNGKV